jgi:phosphoribosyl 1,2-cyclic phosphodiesterase
MSEENPTYDEIAAEGLAFKKKINDMFAEVVGDRAKVLDGLPHDIRKRIQNALQATGEDVQVARDTAFHLTDINSDIAFLMAVYLFPERFTDQEIDYGIGGLIIHMPNHLFAAAKINDCPCEDIFSDQQS